jgi:hypothetical protein
MITYKRIKRISNIIVEDLLFDRPSRGYIGTVPRNVIRKTLSENNLSPYIWDMVVDEIASISDDPHVFRDDHIDVFCDCCLPAFINVINKKKLLLEPVSI